MVCCVVAFIIQPWCRSLFLYPNGSKDDAKNYISIFLSCLNIYQEVTINFTVTFVGRQEGGDKILGMYTRITTLLTLKRSHQEDIWRG